MICLLLGLAIFLVAGGLFLRARYAAQSARQKAALQSAPQPVAAAAAQKGDLPVYLQCLGTVETSTSVVFAIAEDYVQEVVRKRDAGQPLPVEAFDRSFTQLCGTGALVGVDNRMDTETGTLKCKASLLPKGDSSHDPGPLPEPPPAARNPPGGRARANTRRSARPPIRFCLCHPAGPDGDAPPGSGRRRRRRLDRDSERPGGGRVDRHEWFQWPGRRPPLPRPALNTGVWFWRLHIRTGTGLKLPHQRRLRAAHVSH